MTIYKKVVATAGAIALLSLSTLPALAEEASVDASASAEVNVGAPRPRPLQGIREARKDMRQDISEERKDMREGFKEDRTGARQDIKELRASTTMERPDIRQAARGIRASTTLAIKAEREAFREKVKNRRDEIKASTTAAIKNFKEGLKVKLDERRKVRVEKHLDNAFEKLMAAIDRLSKFDDRVTEIIANRKTKGADTSAAETALLEAEKSLDEAKVKVEAIKAATGDAISDANGTSSEALRGAIQAAHDAIKNARAKFVDVLKALPKLAVDASASATTSVQ